MATTPDIQEPQLAAARAAAWHQAGEPLLTLEAARELLAEAGLLLFAPRGAAFGAPAPSLVEATLGAAKESTTAQDAETARTLVARLVGEGTAVPLNLLGGPGDVPDFLVSAQAFPFVFTLRGDKGWKRAPETSGAVKVTPLGLRVYELLVEKGALTLGEIVPEIGREVTESAVARALGELWQLLRVIPVLQQGSGDTRWELLTSRYMKAVKAGANAGQPTALSALVSHYLGQVYVASEEEIASFLSPLTARSRVREVLHGLIAGRQLAESVMQGKTMLYVPDALPDFAAFAPEPADAEAEETEEGEIAQPAEGADQDAPPARIRRFEGEAAAGRELRGKPVRREGSAGPARGGSKPFRAPRPGGPREGGATRRPFGDRPPRRESPGEGAPERRRPSSPRGEFSKPWDEERGSRPPRAEGASERRPRAPREEGSGRPAFGARGPRREGGNREDRPFSPRRGAEDRPPRRFGGDRPTPRRRDGEDISSGSSRSEGAPRSFGERTGRDERSARPTGGFGNRPFRPREDGAGDRPFRRRDGEQTSRPGGDRPFRAGGDRPFRPAGDRPARAGGDRPFRPSGDRPFRPSGDRPFRPAGDRPARPGGDRPFRPSGDRPFRARTDRPAGEGRPRSDGDRPFRPKSDRPFRPSGDRPSRPGGDRPARSEGGRPPRPAGGRPSFGGGGRPSFGGGGGRPPSRGGAAPRGRRDDAAGPRSRPARPPRKPRSEDEAS